MQSYEDWLKAWLAWRKSWDAYQAMAEYVEKRPEQACCEGAERFYAIPHWNSDAEA